MAHAVGLPFELHEPAVVDDVIDSRRNLVVSEDRPPVGELHAGGDHDRLSLVGIGEYLEHGARLRPGGEAHRRGGPLQPLHRGPLPALAAGHGPLGRPGARQGRGDPADRRHGPLARARGHVRRRHRPAVRLRHRHPLGLDRDQRPHGGLRPPLRRRVLGGRRRARGIGPSLGGLVQTLVLERQSLIFTLLCIVAFYAVDWNLSSRPRFAFRRGD